MSKMYRFNSDFPNLIRDIIHPNNPDIKGFRPLHKELSEKLKPLDNDINYKRDSLKLYYLEKLIKDCEGKTKLIFTISPRYNNTEDGILEPIMTLSEKYNIPFINHYSDSSFNFKREYFCDAGVHLNSSGATEYTKVVASEIKQIINKNE